MIDVNTFLERFASLEPEEQAAIDAAITPEVGGALLKIMPELEDVIRPLMQEQQPEPPAGGGGLMGPGGGY